MSLLESSTRLKQSDRQVSCNLNQEVAVLNLDKAVYFGLEGVGAHIWKALEQPRSVDEICKTVVDEFDVSPSACQADVLKFLHQLQDVGLVETVEEGH